MLRLLHGQVLWLVNAHSVLSTDAAVLGDDLLENFLVRNIHLLAGLDTDVDMHVTIANVPVADDQDAGVLPAQGLHHVLPLLHIK